MRKYKINLIVIHVPAIRPLKLTQLSRFLSVQRYAVLLLIWLFSQILSGKMQFCNGKKSGKILRLFKIIYRRVFFFSIK